MRKYLFFFFIVSVLGGLCFDLHEQVKMYETLIEESNICFQCPTSNGPGMSFDSSLILFDEENNPIYYPEYGVFLPLIAGEIRRENYVLYNGQRVFLSTVTPQGEALIINDWDSAWVKYADLSPALD